MFSLSLSAIAAIAMCVTGAMLATTAGAAGGAPTVTNGIAAFTVGDNAPAANTFDVDTLVQGGVANIDPTSLTIVNPAPSADATSTVASSSSHGFVTTTLAVDGSGNVVATGPFSLTFGVCSPGTAAYSATDPTCSTGTLTYEPSSNQNMGDELKILGFVTEDIYEGIGIASVEPATVPKGGTFTLANAAVATALPASDDGFTVNYADEFAAIVPVPAGLTYVPGSIQLSGGDSNTAGKATGKYCTAAGTGCDATINTGNYKTNYPYIEEELPSSIEVAGGQTVTMPTVSAQFTATGAIGTVEPVDLTEFKLNTNVSTAGNVTFDGYPTNSSNGSGTPPYTPPTPLSTTTIGPADTAPAITSSSSTTFTEGSSDSFTVTTSGVPTSSLSETGSLPSGVTFSDNGNGTATLSGTPAVGTNGSYPITIGASNGVSPNASQSFTLTVDAAPAITSAASTTFTQGSAGTFTVTSTGNPTAAFAESGTLPSGVSFADNGDGTATLSGTPGAGSGGTYPITITASNGVSPGASQSFTLTVDAPPTITSSDSAHFAERAHSSFTVISTGTPTAALSETGSLPSGVTFTDNGNGTAALAGTPDTGTAGSYPITITASNGMSPDANQSFTLNVASTAFAPSITSAASTTFQLGSAGSFTVTTTGEPTAAVSESGALPSGVTLTDNGDGTATLAGTPTAQGTYPITITATNGVSPDASQSFTLTVDAAPVITSAASTTFVAGASSSFSVTSTGTPTAALSESGSLPSGVTFTDNGDGTGTLAGTPAIGSNGIYPITITASNGVSPDASQSFTLTVDGPPAITSGDSTTFTEGSSGTFTVTSTGTPTAALSESGSLPSGVTFTDNGDGTATLAGTPTAQGTYPITITATNGVSPDASQSFTLTVDAAPVITSAASTAFVAGASSSFSVTSTGTPTAALSESGSLPSGVTFTDNGDGTGTLSGTPAAGTGGNYPITITASNGVSPDASQSFTLTVDKAPAITSANKTTFTTSSGGSFTVTSTGTPTASLSESGALPSGVTFVDNGNGTGTLSGTPAAGTGGSYPITFGAGNGVGSPASQSFTLTVDQAPAIISAGATTFLVGTRGSFTPTATGYPAPTISESGALPGGVSFTHGSLSGTPTHTGSFPITFTASNGVSPVASQSFTLTVDQAPAITSADATTFTQSAAGSFTVTATGTPTPTLSEFGNLPSGITFTPGAGGTGTLAGTSSQTGSFQIGFIASNGQGSNATQLFTLTIGGLQITTTSPLPPLTEGSPYSTQLNASGGLPPLKWSRTAKLPRGLTLSKTGVLSGTVLATKVAPGTYAIPVKVTDATKRTHQTATETFQLQINS